MIAQCTEFRLDAEHSALEARVLLSPMVSASGNGASPLEFMPRVEALMTSILSDAASPLPGTRYFLRSCGDQILLSGTLSLTSATFRDVLYALRKLERLADRLAFECNRAFSMPVLDSASN